MDQRGRRCDLENNQHYPNNHPEISVVDGVKYLQAKQTYEERRMDACCGCAARWSIKLCDVIGSFKHGWVYVLVTNS